MTTLSNLQLIEEPAHFPIKVLVADDDLPTRMLLKAAISQWGYEVLEASNGEEAWELLQKDTIKPPMLLVLDWVMPKLDGIELSEKIKNHLNFHPYIILLTQMSGTSNIVKALESGADEFLTKPFNMTELHSRLLVGAKIVTYQHRLAKQRELLKKYKLNIKNISNGHMFEIIQKKEFVKMLKSVIKITRQLSDDVNKLLPNIYHMNPIQKDDSINQIQNIQHVICNLNFAIENIKTLLSSLKTANSLGHVEERKHHKLQEKE